MPRSWQFPDHHGAEEGAYWMERTKTKKKKKRKRKKRKRRKSERDIKIGDSLATAPVLT